MALKIMDEHERVPKSEYAIEALEYAIKMGAIISCNSYGIHCYKYNVQPDGHFCDKYFNDFRNLLQGAPEHVFVGAAGNIGNCNDDVPSLPCNVKAPNVLCVAASTEQNEIESVGEMLHPNSMVDKYSDIFVSESLLLSL